MNCWWRIYIGARLHSQDAQCWHENQLGLAQAGCRQKRDALSALIPLADSFTKGHILCSLDLSQAFDRLRPNRAIDTMLSQGLPMNLANAVRSLWGRQNRILQWAGSSKPTKVRVDSSLPQGDSMSPWALNIVLAAAVKVITEAHHQSAHVVYVDDRTFTAPTVEECVGIWGKWQWHVKALGMKDNLGKTQFTCRKKKGQDELKQNPTTSPFFKECLVALGVCFTASGRAPPQEKEVQRFRKAHVAADRAAMAPHIAAVRQFFVNSTVVCKATYGWILRAPLRKSQNRLESAVRRAGYGHKVASPNLVKLVVGHSLDPGFMCAQTAFTALIRNIKFRNMVPTDWTLSGGISARIRRYMKSLEWQVVAPFHWWHEGIQTSVNLSRLPVVREVSEFTHILRESWRYCQWQSFTKAHRRDSMTLRWYPYDPQRCQAARKRVMHQGGAIHEVACMTGAFVSPLRLARIDSSFDGRCFRCGDQFGSKHHMIWQCPALRGTPPMPEDLLEKELGWPICAGQTGALQHMAKVRQECLQKRWRHEPSWGGWGGGHLRIVLPSLVACCRAAAFVNVYYGWF